MAPCQKCGSLPPEAARFCHGCGSPVPAAPEQAVEQGERRTVTVVFADLSGFTSYSEHTDPERVRAVADEAAAGMAAIVESYGGTVDKVIGDCVMGVFGAPVAHDDDPERAVRAAVDMRDFVADNADRLAEMPLSIGINTGEVMFAPVAGAMTVIGDAVNTAARLQSAATRGEILIGAATARACSTALELEEMLPIVAKGKDEPVAVWRVERVRDAAPRRVVRWRAALVGREAEMSRLEELWQRARANRRPHLATVLGEPGVGKSRVIAEMVKTVEGATVVTGRCLPYGAGITYWPILEIIKQLASIQPDDDPAAVASKLDHYLTALGSEDLEEVRTVAGAVAIVLGITTTPRGTYSVGSLSQIEVHWGLRRLFELAARQRPLVLVVEDLHWAEVALLDLLDHVVAVNERVSGPGVAGDGEAPLLVLATARPEVRDRDHALLARGANRRTIQLTPLGGAASDLLLARLLGTDHVTAEVAALLADVAGNPLFLEEAVRMLEDADVLVDGHLREGVDAATLQVPTSVQAVIDARLDQLPARERRVLGYAAVAGASFAPAALNALADSPEPFDDAVAELERRDLLRVEGDNLVFAHALVRDAAYARLAKEWRVTLHARCARWLGGLPNAEEELVEILAHHLEQACLLAQDVEAAEAPPVLAAVEALRRAAKRAERRQGVVEALHFYERALALIADGLPETAAELRLRRCFSLAVLARFTDAAEEAAVVVDLAQRMERADVACEALLIQVKSMRVTGQADDARPRVEEARRLAEDLGNEELRVQAVLALALVDAAVGDLEAAITGLGEGAALASALGDRREEAQAYLQLGAIHLNVGALGEAETALERAAAAAGRETGVHQQAQATALLAMVRRYRGPREEAEVLAQQAVEWLDRVADRYVAIQARRILVALALEEDDLDTAEQRARQALAAAEGLSGWAPAEIRRDLARILAAKGAVEGAAAVAATIRADADPADDFAVARALLAEAAVAAAVGDPATAESRYRDAIDIFERHHLGLDAAEVRHELGCMLVASGRLTDAGVLLQLAFDAFTAMGADAAAARTKQVLATLAA